MKASKVKKKQAPRPEKKRDQIPLHRKILYSLVIQILILGTAELLVRVILGAAPKEAATVGTRKFVTWLSDLSTGPRREIPLYREDRQLMWSLVPNTRIQSFNHHRAERGELQPIQITINSDGYRGRLETSAERTNSRVLCLGDSNFFGYPLDDSQAFPQVLENALNRDSPQHPWEVINGGVPGYTTVQGKLWYSKMFGQHRHDVLLLSFLNNDAWLQPQTDDVSLRWLASKRYLISTFLHHSQLVCWAERWITSSSQKPPGVPRVPLEGFARHYQDLITQARQNNTRVVILDYRAYPEYEPYSRKLRELAGRSGVDYVAVAELLGNEIKKRERPAKYAQLAERVQRRWGALLDDRPYLWYYAEFHPEHLNEVGVAWLADWLAPLIAAKSDTR